MKKYFILTLLAFSFIAQAQVTANRFFYELTYKPKKDSAKLEKVMSVLDITPEKSLFRDYTMIAQDSIMKVKVEEMQKAGMYKDFTKDIKKPKFSYKITKTYPSMELEYAEGILNGMSAINLAYKETPKFDWKIEAETQKIGEYNTQKATTKFGGRTWTAWFSKNIPMQDGPYKFSGLPGLIVKIEDADLNYSWELKGNKPVPDFEETTYMEKMQSGGGSPKTIEVDRAKFETKFTEYKKDPFGSLRAQIPVEAMSTKIPGSDKTIGEMVKDQEKMLNDFYGATDNPVELAEATNKKKK
jgi:GLPGLI family protein